MSIVQRSPFQQGPKRQGLRDPLSGHEFHYFSRVKTLRGVAGTATFFVERPLKVPPESRPDLKPRFFRYPHKVIGEETDPRVRVSQESLIKKLKLLILRNMGKSRYKCRHLGEVFPFGRIGDLSVEFVRPPALNQSRRMGKIQQARENFRESLGLGLYMRLRVSLFNDGKET